MSGCKIKKPLLGDLSCDNVTYHYRKKVIVSKHEYDTSYFKDRYQIINEYVIDDKEYYEIELK